MNLFSGTFPCIHDCVATYTPGETEKVYLRNYEEIITGVYTHNSEFHGEIHPWDGFRPPVEVTINTPVVEAVHCLQMAVTGKKSLLTEIKRGTDTSDGDFYTCLWAREHNLLTTVEECILP